MGADWNSIPTLLFVRLPCLWVYFVQGCFLKMRLCDSVESLGTTIPKFFFSKDENGSSNCMRLCSCNHAHKGPLLGLMRGAAQELLAFSEDQCLRVLDGSLVPSLWDSALFAVTLLSHTECNKQLRLRAERSAPPPPQMPRCAPGPVVLITPLLARPDGPQPSLSRPAAPFLK